MKYMADYSETLYTALRGKKKHDKAREDAGLPSNWNGRADKDILAAIAKYKEIQLDYVPTVRLLNALEQGMMLSGDAVEGQLDQMEAAMETATRLATLLKETDDINEAQELMQSMLDTSTLVQARIQGFMKMVADIPKAIKQIKELQEEVKLEKSGAINKRGGYKKGNREDPK